MKKVLVNTAKNLYTFVDNCDVDIFDQFATRATTGLGYVILRSSCANGKKGKYAYLHRIILARVAERELARKEVTDHIDGDPLNNLRGNLRICTQGQNTCNQKKRGSSPHKGYRFDPSRDRWVVQIGYQGKNYQKRFKSMKEAREYAYHLRETLHKEFANHD